MQRKLAIQAARFGDLVQTKRLVLTLQEHGEFHLAVDSSMASLARILYPGAVVHSLAFHGSPSRENMELNVRAFADLGKCDFKEIYNCNFSSLTSAMCRIFPENKLIGYRPAHVSSGGLLASAWTRLGFRLSAMRQLTSLNLVDYWGNFSSSPVPPERVNPEAGRGNGIGIALAGRVERRSLPIGALAQITEIAWRLLGRPGIRLFGTGTELPRARKLLRLLPPSMESFITNLCGKTGWEDLKKEISGLALMLTPDTGLMHLAAFCGVPVIAFFLSSAWCHETGPYGLGHKIFQAALPCSPCLESAECTNNTQCASAFLHPDFPRAFAQALQNRDVVSLPPGMQLWETSMDRLGVNLRLVAGEDRWAESRYKVREIISEFLHLGTGLISDNVLLEKLIPPSEWMLPGGRYC